MPGETENALTCLAAYQVSIRAVPNDRDDGDLEVTVRVTPERRRDWRRWPRS